MQHSILGAQSDQLCLLYRFGSLPYMSSYTSPYTMPYASMMRSQMLASQLAAQQQAAYMSAAYATYSPYCEQTECTATIPC